MRIKDLFLIILILYQSFILKVKSGSCEKYPNEVGVNLIEKKKNIIIYSTAKVKIYIDDDGEIKDALDDAERIATVNIAKFLRTKVKLDDDKSIFISQDSSFEKEEKIYNLETNLILKGIKLINKCYEKGNYVMVTVEMDPNNINQINKLKTNLDSSNKWKLTII